MTLNLEVSPSVSDKYVFIDTNKLIVDLKQEGFNPYLMKKRTKKSSYHQLKFVNENNYSFILENSYDKTRAFVVSFITDISSDTYFAFGESHLYQKHYGKPAEDIKEMFVKQMGFYFNRIKRLIDIMKKTEITEDKLISLYSEAFKRFRNNEKHSVDVKEIIKSIHSRNLYDVYVELHKILKNGLYEFKNANGKLRKARVLKNHKRFLKLSNDLYYLLVIDYPELTI